MYANKMCCGRAVTCRWEVPEAGVALAPSAPYYNVILRANRPDNLRNVYSQHSRQVTDDC